LRLSKFLAEAGVASRRQAEKLIASGRVKVNGSKVLKQGYKIDPGSDKVELDGKIVFIQDKKVYLLLNKPPGYISSVVDSWGRPTVIDLVEDIKERIYPVGRLDFDTEGLLLLSNDGDFANLMTHPRYKIKKKYEAWVEGDVKTAALKLLAEGVVLDDGLTAPARVHVLKRQEGKTLLELEIHEGRKRQVKRMCSAVGHELISLKRTAFSFLTLEGVPLGKYRHLSLEEVERLKRIAGGGT